jgi:hypothetical protein
MKLKHIFKNYHVQSIFKFILISVCVFVSIVAFRKTYHKNIEGLNLKKIKKKMKKAKKSVNKGMKKFKKVAGKKFKKGIKNSQKAARKISKQFKRRGSKKFKRKLRQKRREKRLKKTKKKFTKKHKNFLSSETRSSCDLLYDKHPYGLFSFVKQGSTNTDNYQNPQNHFVTDCGFYGCKVGVLNKTNNIDFVKGDDIRTKKWKYKGPEQFYLKCDSDNENCNQVNFGDTVKLYSTKKSKKDNRKNAKEYIISDMNNPDSNNKVKYNSDVRLTLLENNTPVDIHILAAPNSTSSAICPTGTIGATYT